MTPDDSKTTFTTTVGAPEVEWRELEDLFDSVQESSAVSLQGLPNDYDISDLDSCMLPPLELPKIDEDNSDTGNAPSFTNYTTATTASTKDEPQQIVINVDTKVVSRPPKPPQQPPTTTANPERRARTSSPTPATTSGRIDKPKISCTLKEKREREARQFPRALLSNLDGTTSAEVRKMTSEERELVLYKRKLRNRESARRSRQKRQATLADLHDEIGELQNVAKRMVDLGASLHATNVGLKDKLNLAEAEIRALRAAYDHPTKNKAGA